MNPPEVVVTVDGIYSSFLNKPGRWIIGFLFFTITIAVLPVEKWIWWPNQSPDWARSVFAVANLLIVAAFALIPIARWYEDRQKEFRERGREIAEQKPIVLTDLLPDGTFSVRNVGNAPAANVWVLTRASIRATTLGSLDAHESRQLTPELSKEMSAESDGHVLISEAKPNTQRPFTVTFNVREGDAVRHGFDPAGPRLTTGGTIYQYMEVHRLSLLINLAVFADSGSKTYFDAAIASAKS